MSATVNAVRDDVVVAESFKFSDLWRKEDWLSIWIAFIVIAVAAIGCFPNFFAGLIRTTFSPEIFKVLGM